jgi:divalent metal cation (Fe/Co/Zn/Cd) transporter
MWDGIASVSIGVVLAFVAFGLARTSRGLLLGEAATTKMSRRFAKPSKRIRALSVWSNF